MTRKRAGAKKPAAEKAPAKKRAPSKSKAVAIPRCSARSKQTGLPCKKSAGYGTAHPGVGNCKFHGGNAPVRHGRYSKIRREQLRDLIAEYAADPDPLNLEPELAAMRALFDGYVSRYDEIVEALLEWNRAEVAAKGALAFPQRIPPLEAAAKLLSEASKIVKRVEDVRAQNAVSRADLLRILREVGAIVRRHNHEPDPEVRLQLISDDWDRIAF